MLRRRLLLVVTSRHISFHLVAHVTQHGTKSTCAKCDESEHFPDGPSCIKCEKGALPRASLSRMWSIIPLRRPTVHQLIEYIKWGAPKALMPLRYLSTASPPPSNQRYCRIAGAALLLLLTPRGIGPTLAADASYENDMKNCVKAKCTAAGFVCSICKNGFKPVFGNKNKGYCLKCEAGAHKACNSVQFTCKMQNDKTELAVRNGKFCRGRYTAVTRRS